MIRSVRLLVLGFYCSILLHAGEPGTEVVLVYNTAFAGSKEVADHYASIRQVPKDQIIGLSLPETEAITRDQFERQLQGPLWRELLGRKLFIPGSPSAGNNRSSVSAASVRYAVLCYGVPVKIAPDSTLKEDGLENVRIELRRNEAAIDSELAMLPMYGQPLTLSGPVNNPVQAATNREALHPTNGVLMVTRLDGPSVAIAKGLVDKAVAAERDGLWGRAYFDWRSLAEGPYKVGDEWIKRSYEVAKAYGFECITDTNANTFPPSAPLSDIALYFGWYDQSVSGPFTNGMAEFRPGAIAYHLHSFSARTLRLDDNWWAGPLLARGATATMGCTEEPYLQTTPQVHILLHRLVFLKFTFGEAAYACQNALSWQNTIIGDPLYQPFARNQAEIHAYLEARKDKNIEWSMLGWINVRLNQRATLDEIEKFYTTNPETKTSAVLQEKLGEIYKDRGKYLDAQGPYTRALKLDMDPIQKLRVMLAAAALYSSMGKPALAYDLYKDVLRDYPKYTDKRDIYQHLAKVAARLEKTSEALEFERLGGGTP